MIRIWFRSFISEHVLEVIGEKRAAILPLRVADAIALSNSDPSMAADRLSWPRVGLLEPRDHERRFGLELIPEHVVVGKRIIEWILTRDECDWNVIAARLLIRIVGAPVVCHPMRIPHASSVALFSHPKYRGCNVFFPRIALYGHVRSCRFAQGRNLIHFLLAQFHRPL